ncbi:hypothetical protein [Actinomadura sp. DC4]|uniref:hypothetical protein n=1 Tax=Actinomadura sp. DC4 TaxID=3055069 RepID=UPI0025AF8851|nr:hypothetical protein [Actinomadura sp. DC4]MDN3355947.1 hypothetical protein [Actinomadura sp. DC4]
MRARRGWIAALLLVALAFIGGPDALDTTPPPTHTAAAAGEIAEKRDPQVRDDDTDVQHQIAELGVPGHLRLSALPPSSQTVAPAPVRGMEHAVPQAASVAVADVGRRPHPGACSPEALQIFRC